MHFWMDDYVLDIFQNAAEAGSSLIEVELEESEDSIRVLVRDNGPGMDAQLAERVLDPFVTDGKKHPGRKVGLGLPFLQQAALQTGGSFELKTAPAQGTAVEWIFPAGHWDTPPLGSVTDLWCTLLNWPGGHELVIRRLRCGHGGDYEIRRSDLIEALGSLEDVGALALLKDFVRTYEENRIEGACDGKDDPGRA